MIKQLLITSIIDECINKATKALFIAQYTITTLIIDCGNYKMIYIRNPVGRITGICISKNAPLDLTLVHPYDDFDTIQRAFHGYEILHKGNEKLTYVHEVHKLIKQYYGQLTRTDHLKLNNIHSAGFRYQLE